MNVSFSPINFKGYDALPLKAIHIEEATSAPIKKEMQNIASKENFKLRSGLDYYKWAQDMKMVIEKDNKPFIVANNRVDANYLDEMKRKYNISSKVNDLIATGGNTFIGKYPNGEKWMMVGYDELRTKSYQYLASEYGIKEENIIPIPQQYYHLDMFMRPIGYPYVLVDNPELSRKKLSSMDIKDGAYDYLNLTRNFQNYEHERAINYDSHKAVINSLENAGFIPIEIAGVLGSGINFMNAIVNKHIDGTISYITNSTRCDSPFVSKIEKEFEKELRDKVPNIDKVYFVQGMDEFDTQMSNYMMDNVHHRGGGIHCMTMEEPNFECWI